MASLASPLAHPRDRAPGRAAFATALLLLLLLLSMILNLSLGAVPIPLRDILGALVHGVPADPGAAGIITGLRLPRLLAAIAVGAALAAAGTALQALFRNPLADPGLLGVSTGAALGAALWFTGGAALAALLPVVAPFLLPAASFAGALSAILIVLLIGSRAGPQATILMLLVGIGVNALGGAVIGLVTYLATDSALRSLSVWLLGSLAQSDWTVLVPALLVLASAVAGLARHAPALDLLALGEDGARHLGVDVPKLRRSLALLSAMAVGAAVSLSGIIGFVGLVIPHMLRLLIGPGHRALLPLSALGGAVALSLADLVARLVALPAEVPVGVVMAFVGAPAFLWVLLSQWRKPG